MGEKVTKFRKPQQPVVKVTISQNRIVLLIRISAIHTVIKGDSPSATGCHGTG
jgi:hypothetical protein